MNQYRHDREWGLWWGERVIIFFIFVLQEIKWKPRKWGICDHWRLKLFVITRLDRYLNISFHTQSTQILELETLVMLRKERVIFSASFTALFWTITERAPRLPGRWLFLWPCILIKQTHVIYGKSSSPLIRLVQTSSDYEPSRFFLEGIWSKSNKPSMIGGQKPFGFSSSHSSLERMTYTLCDRHTEVQSRMLWLKRHLTNLQQCVMQNWKNVIQTNRVVRITLLDKNRLSPQVRSLEDVFTGLSKPSETS